MFETSLGLRENPFLAGHLPKYVFPSREHQEALAHLRYGIQNREPFVLITGEVGTGKTTAVYDALAEWGSRAVVALITNSALTRSELLEEICLRFGVTLPSPISKPHALVALQRQLSASRSRGELAILLVDEAQNLDRELLEEIRLLSNLEEYGTYLLQIFLVGQPELETKLSQRELRQLRQRIGIHYRILPLSATETARYIHHRISVAGGNAEELFPPEACVEIFRITNGIPREINIVAGQALLNAFVEDASSVTPEHVRAVEREIEFQSVLQEPGEPATPRKEPAAKPAPARATRTRSTRGGRKGKAAAAAREPAESAEATEPPRARRSISRTSAAPESQEERGTPPAPLLFPGLAAPWAGPSREAAAPSAPAGRAESTATRPQPAGAPLLPAWLEEAAERARQAGAAGPGAARVPPTPPGAAPGPAPFGTPPSGAAWPARGAEESPPGFEPGATRGGDLPLPLRPAFGEGEEAAPSSRGMPAWPVASLMIVALAIAVLLLARFGPWTIQGKPPAGAARPAPAAPPTTAPPVEPAGTGMQETPAPPARNARPAARPPAQPPATTRAEAGAAGATRTPAPVATPQTPPPAAATPDAVAEPAATAPSPEAVEPAPAVPSAPMRMFSIEVGTYLNEARAQSERGRLREGTPYPTRIVKVDESGVAMHRVVIGAFDDREAAERAASDLVQRGLVNEARVVAVVQPASEPR